MTDASSAETEPKIRKGRVILCAAAALGVGFGAGYFGAQMVSPSEPEAVAVEHEVSTIDAGNFALFFSDGERPLSVALEVDLAPGVQYVTKARVRDEVTRMMAVIMEMPLVPRSSKAEFTIEEAFDAIISEESSWISDIRALRLIPGKRVPADKV
jgi:hypothetical protein